MSTLSFILILKIWCFYQFTGLESWYCKISSNHAKNIELCRKKTFWDTKKSDMVPNRKKKDQNENWAPMNVFFFVRRHRPSVRRGDRFFPGTLFQDRHRRPAAGEPETLWKISPDFNQWNKVLILHYKFCTSFVIFQPLSNDWNLQKSEVRDFAF